MCNGTCGCGHGEQQEPEISDYDAGYIDGFRDARMVFWKVFQYKASDSRMVAKTLRELDESSMEADTLDILYSAYLHAADCIARDQREYPGYVVDDIEVVDWSSFE